MLAPRGIAVSWPDVNGLPQHASGCFRPEYVALGAEIPGEVAVRVDVFWSVGVIRIHVASKGDFRISVYSSWTFTARLMGYGVELPGDKFYGETLTLWHGDEEVALYITLLYSGQLPSCGPTFLTVMVWHGGESFAIWY